MSFLFLCIKIYTYFKTFKSMKICYGRIISDKVTEIYKINFNIFSVLLTLTFPTQHFNIFLNKQYKAGSHFCFKYELALWKVQSYVLPYISQYCSFVKWAVAPRATMLRNVLRRYEICYDATNNATTLCLSLRVVQLTLNIINKFIEKSNNTNKVSRNVIKWLNFRKHKQM